MTRKRFFAVLLFTLVVGGTLAFSKASDLGILYKAGKKAHTQIRNVLPETRKLTEPLTALRVTDALPVEERVQIRISADKDLHGGQVLVSTGPTTGSIKLRGVVQSSELRNRAQDLATTTHGVESVLNELAVPEGK
jgi:osmotically-inducible protein OsmY